MLRRLLGDLPDWMQPDHPLLRYELQRHQVAVQPRARMLRIAGWSVLLAVLVLAGYFYATDWLQRDLGLPYTVDLWRILYYPIFALQLLFAIAGLSLATSAINDERRRQTWDNLRATEIGTATGLRTRWFSIFYRLRTLGIMVLLARLALVAAILYELTSMQGIYLDILANRSNPPVPLVLAVLLLAAQLTALLLLPFSSVGVDIALGLLIASAFRNRVTVGILQVLIVIVRVGIALAALWLLTQLINRHFAPDSPLDMLLLTAGSILGDSGLAVSQLSQNGQLWAAINGSILLGALLLLAAAVQIALASWLLDFAVRTAERVD